MENGLGKKQRASFSETERGKSKESGAGRHSKTGKAVLLR